jgi:hypothetical protein
VHPLARRAKTIADEALLRAISAAGGGGGSGGGAAQAFVYVNVNGGVDAPGNGTFAHPYASISYALSQITDASPTKTYTVWIAGGDYAAASIKPYIYLTGIDPLNLPFVTTLTVAPSFGANVFAGMTNITFPGPINLDFSASPGASFIVYNCVFDAVAVMGTAAGFALTSFFDLFFAPITFSPGSAGAWDTFYDTFLNSVTIAGSSSPSTFVNVGSVFEKTLMIEGSGVSYSYSADGIPSAGLIFSGGATPAQLHPFTNPGDWEVVTSGSAIAAGALLKTIAGGFVPLATTDDAGACVGVSLDAAVASGIAVRSQNIGQAVTVLNDGAAAIAVGDRIIPSTVTAGRVTHSSTIGVPTVGVALSAGAAAPGAAFQMYFQPGQV